MGAGKVRLDSEAEEENNEENNEDKEDFMELDEQVISECQARCTDLIELSKKSNERVEYRTPNNMSVIDENRNDSIIPPRILQLTTNTT